MSYTITTPEAGVQPADATETTQRHPLGKIVEAEDPTYGGGELIYLKGVASTVVGSAVIYDQFAGTTTLAVAGSRGPVAFALSINVASQYGWYQIAGAAVAKAVTVAANLPCFLDAIAGSVDDAGGVGDKIEGATTKTADGTPSAGFAVLQLDRPAANGNG
jgi:hypothetical protein